MAGGGGVVEQTDTLHTYGRPTCYPSPNSEFLATRDGERTEVKSLVSSRGAIEHQLCW